MYILLTTYSFAEPHVDIFKTEAEAKAYLKKIVNEEYRVDTEENEWRSTLEWNEDFTSAKLTNRFEDHDDVTEFTLISDVNIRSTPTVYVEVEDGLVQKVFTDSDPVDVIVMDYDELAVSDDDDEELHKCFEIYEAMQKNGSLKRLEELPIDDSSSTYDDIKGSEEPYDPWEDIDISDEYLKNVFDNLAEASYTDYISQMAHLSHASHCETDNEPIMSDDSDITEDDPVMEDDPHYDDSVIDDDYLRWASEHYWEEEAEFAAGTHPTQVRERIEQRLSICGVNYETLELRNWADTSVDIVLDGKFFGHFDYKNNCMMNK